MIQEKLRQLTLELKKNMVGMKPLANHHSTGDWDFSATNWELDTVRYVSAPSSWNGTTSTPLTVFVKTAVVPIANVKEGRIISYQRGESAARIFFWYLRYQDANNHYVVELLPNSTTQNIKRVKAGASTTLQGPTGVNWAPLYQFRRVRITWWNDYVGLVIRLEYWTGSEWAKILADAYDAENNWKDIGGRVGFKASFYHFVDDTEIYGVV